MRALARLGALLVLILMTLTLIALVVERSFFSSRVFETGEVYGFEIGQTREDAYQTALELIGESQAAEIHTWPAGEFHRPFRDGEDPANDQSQNWKIVVDPEWWNNSVTLTFEQGHIVQIRRNRVLMELP